MKIFAIILIWISIFAGFWVKADPAPRAPEEVGAKAEIDPQIIKQEILDEISRDPTVSADVISQKPAAIDKSEARPAAASLGIGAGDSLKMFGMLAVVLSLFLGCVVLIKKAGKKIAKNTHAQMEILSRMMIAPKRELILARVGEEMLLIGSSEAGLTMMTTIESIKQEAGSPMNSDTTLAEKSLAMGGKLGGESHYKVELRNRVKGFRPDL